MSGLMGSSVGPQDHSVVIFLTAQYGIGMDTLYSWQNYRVIFLAYELRANAVREVLCKMSLCITNLKDPHDSVNVYPTAYPFNSCFQPLLTKWIWKMTGYSTNSSKPQKYINSHSFGDI